MAKQLDTKRAELNTTGEPGPGPDELAIERRVAMDSANEAKDAAIKAQRDMIAAADWLDMLEADPKYHLGIKAYKDQLALAAKKKKAYNDAKSMYKGAAVAASKTGVNIETFVGIGRRDKGSAYTVKDMAALVVYLQSRPEYEGYIKHGVTPEFYDELAPALSKTDLGHVEAVLNIQITVAGDMLKAEAKAMGEAIGKAAGQGE